MLEDDKIENHSVHKLWSSYDFSPKKKVFHLKNALNYLQGDASAEPEIRASFQGLLVIIT